MGDLKKENKDFKYYTLVDDDGQPICAKETSKQKYTENIDYYIKADGIENPCSLETEQQSEQFSEQQLNRIKKYFEEFCLMQVLKNGEKEDEE